MIGTNCAIGENVAQFLVGKVIGASSGVVMIDSTVNNPGKQVTVAISWHQMFKQILDVVVEVPLSAGAHILWRAWIRISNPIR